MNHPPRFRDLVTPIDVNQKCSFISSSHPVLIHVMSYNVLADQLATPDFHPLQTSQELDFAFRAPRIIEEIRQSGASLVFLQELDRIDDFYDEKLKSLGFSVVYGQRGSQDGKKAKHTIAIAYQSSEWLLIDQELIDLGEVKKWFLNNDAFELGANRNAMLCILQHRESN